jgi:hypothetical protein
MNKEEIIEQIQGTIGNYGSIHCYQDVIGGCINTPTIGNQVNGIPFSQEHNHIDYNGYLQGFNKLAVVFVIYKNRKPNDSYSIRYQQLSVSMLEEVLKFLQRK